MEALIVLFVLLVVVVGMPGVAVVAVFLLTKPERELSQAMAVEQIKRAQLETKKMENDLMDKLLER